eukprot:g3399.t1
MSERFAGHDLKTVEYISNSVAKALKHMHDQGLVHGDVKPRNVVRDASGKWKLIDLDAATKLSEPIGRKYSSAFSPPELAKFDDNIFEPSVAKELMRWNEIDIKRLSFVFQNDKGFIGYAWRRCS